MKPEGRRRDREQPANISATEPYLKAEAAFNMKLRDYFIASATLILAAVRLAGGTSLDDFIKAPPKHYRYTLVNTIRDKIITGYVLRMNSQSWRTSAEVDRTLWRHRLTIYEPFNVASNRALLWIGAGSNDDPEPKGISGDFVLLAYELQAVVVHLTMVPNQPLTFSDSKGEESEDAIIAYTFDKYMATGDDTWPVLLPMTRSVVRAMDATHSHLVSATKGRLNISEFVLAGASKRGWAAWLAAAVDKRVVGIVPIAIDMLNLDEQMKHHLSAYGRHSDAAGDYTKSKIFDRLGTPRGQELLAIVDPYEYRRRYTMPKFLINSAGDRLFLPDSAKFYFHDLPDPKYLRYVPNTDHGLTDLFRAPRFTNSDAFESLKVFTEALLHGKQIPRYSWKITDDDAIEVHTQTTPKTATLWQAVNTEDRDFRHMRLWMRPGIRKSSHSSPFDAWSDSPLTAQSPGIYVARIPQPEEGWAAFFVELTYENGSEKPYKFTTEVHVIPHTLPFAEKAGSSSSTTAGIEDQPRQ